MTLLPCWHCQQICQQPGSERVKNGLAKLEGNSLATYHQTPDFIEEFEAELIGFKARRRRPNDPSSATRSTGTDYNRDALAEFVAAHGEVSFSCLQYLPVYHDGRSEPGPKNCQSSSESMKC